MLQHGSCFLFFVFCFFFQATKYPGNNTVELPCGTTFKKQPPIENTKVRMVKALQLEPLVNDHLL